MSNTIYGLLSLIATTAGYTIQAVAQGLNDSNGTSINIISGTGGTLAPGGQAGNINLTGATGNFANQGGNINITGGTSGPTGVGGNINITGGSGVSGTTSTGGAITITSGSALSADSNAGQVILQPGFHTGNAIPALMGWNGSIYSNTSGTSQIFRVERLVVNLCNPNLTLDASLNLFSWTLNANDPNETYASASVFYSVMATQNIAEVYTNQLCNGQVNFTSAINDDLVNKTSVSTLYELNSGTDDGVLSTTWTIGYVDGNDPSICYLACTPSSTTMTTPYYLVIFMTLLSNCQTNISYINP